MACFHLQVMHLALSARQYSPRLEMYARLAEQALQLHRGPAPCCFAHVEGTGAIVLRTEDVGTAVASPAALDPSAEGTGVGHVYGGTNPSQSATVALYAAPGTDCFRAWHLTLKSLVASRADIRYVLRPVLRPSACSMPPASSCLLLGAEGPLDIPGFGVEMVLKNTEYSAKDDTPPPGGAPPAEGAPAAPSDDEEDEPSAPAGRDSDDASKDKKIGKKSSGKQLSEEEQRRLKFRHLGLQTVQRVLAAQSDPLAALQDLAQHFPSYSDSLSLDRVNRTLLKAARQAATSVGVGDRAALLINGILFDHMRPTLELHRLVPRLAGEVALADAIRSLGFSPEDTRQLLALRGEASSNAAGGRFAQASGSGADGADAEEDEEDDGMMGAAMGGAGGGRGSLGTRLNVRDFPSVLPYANDVESDREYSSFPFKEVGDVLNPQLMMYPIKPVARNMFHAHVLLDPLTAEGLAAAAAYHEMLEGRFPVRFGLGLLAPPADPGEIASLPSPLPALLWAATPMAPLSNHRHFLDGSAACQQDLPSLPPASVQGWRPGGPAHGGPSV